MIVDKRTQRFKRLFNLFIVTEQHEENLYSTIARYINSYNDKCIIVEIKNNLKPSFSIESGNISELYDKYRDFLFPSRCLASYFK